MRFVCPSFSDIYSPNVEVKSFPDGDSYVRVPGALEGAGKDVFLFTRLYPNQDVLIFQAILALRALKEAKPKSITLVVPYLPYSRQDKIAKEGEVKSAEILCELLAREGAGKLVTFDCHFLKKEGEFTYGGLKIKNISLSKKIIEKAREIAGGEIEIMSPDEGANYLVQEAGGTSMKKVRGDYIKGNEAYREIKEIKMSADVKGKSVLIIDDMISTGSTMLRAVENVKKGGARKVICAAAHGFFLKDSLAKLKASGEVFVSDTIPSPVSAVSIKPFLDGLFK
jgi:ribose-phosphate pyrophosphokinase